MGSSTDTILDSRFGWWSKTENDATGRVVVYLNEEGSEVRCTTITSDEAGDRLKKTQDRIPLGRLTSFVRVEDPRFPPGTVGPFPIEEQEKSVFREDTSPP